MEDKDKFSRQSKVKNKSAAEIQITAEQLLQEAHERLEGDEFTRKKTFIGREDVGEFRQRSRANFESNIVRNRGNVNLYLKYAKFEENQEEWARARSVYERALDVDPRNQVIWMKYAEMEMKLKNINLARNIWNRAVTILPRVDQFWYKFAYMEEMLGAVEAAREIFDRWMRWEPEEAVWYSFIKFEQRYKQFDNIRVIYSRLISVHPNVNNWIKWAEWEESRGAVKEARAVFERACDFIPENEREPRLFIAFAKFETRQKEFERARAIYRLALSLFPSHLVPGLYNSYAQFEREYGDSSFVIDQVVLNKRRNQYAAVAETEPYNYDNWFDWIRLEEEFLESSEDFGNQGNPDEKYAAIREVFERAIGQVPPVDDEKRHWRRYIYLWLNYAVFEEATAGCLDRALTVLKTCLSIIPHRKFTFTKVWNHLAMFHVRRSDLSAARKTFGQAIGMCGAKPSLFDRYIKLELDLREFDRARLLYQKHLTLEPTRAVTWTKFAELERLLLNDDRARAILQLAISQPILDIPELAWKSFIDFEFESGEFDRVRDLYESLLERTDFNLKIWISFANMETSIEDEQGDLKMERVRKILTRAYDHFKSKGNNTERVVLLEAWKELEGLHGTEESVQKIVAKFPRRIKKRRRVQINAGDFEDGEADHHPQYTWEEFYDYVFPDDETSSSQAKGHLKLLEMAHQWKKSAAQ